jgi:PAS domain S-box-containing protein
MTDLNAGILSNEVYRDMSANKTSVLPAEPPFVPPIVNRESHVVHFYDNDRSLVEEVAGFIGSSLIHGDAGIVIGTEAHREAIGRELKGRGVNLSRAIAEGRYISLDAARTLRRLMSGEMPDALRFEEMIGGIIADAKAAAKSELPCVVIFGEPVALLWATGNRRAAIRLEDLWNSLAEKHVFSLRCAYPMNGFQNDQNGDFLRKVCGQHSGVAPEKGLGLEVSDEESLEIIAKLHQRVQILENKKALHESEERFRLLVEAVQDYAIFMLDPEGRVSSWNAGAERIKGYTESEILGKHFSCFYPEQDIRAGKPERELEIARREGRVEDEGWRLRKDGSRFWALAVITALKDNKGRILGFAKVTRDFSERRQAQETLEESQRKLRDSERSLRELSLRLLRTQDEERRRIARDLHDSLGQYLSVLKMKLDALKTTAIRNKSEGAKELEQSTQLTEEAIKEVRTISYLLYPPMLEELGLKSAIPWYVDGFTTRSGIQTAFKLSPGFGRLPGDVELVLFRVLQESLTNIHRHSGSTTADVQLSVVGDEVVLTISDKGKGISPQSFEERSQDGMGARGVGLRGMTERVRQIGGRLELSSTPEGTTVTAVVPVQQKSPT